MKLFLVSRYDELYPDRNDLSVVVAETPESAVEIWGCFAVWTPFLRVSGKISEHFGS